jgi:CBS domain-containing protein
VCDVAQQTGSRHAVIWPGIAKDFANQNDFIGSRYPLRDERPLTMDSPIRQPEQILAYRPLRQVLGPKSWDLRTVGGNDTVLTALRAMADRNIGFLVVLEQAAMIGVLSERDCVRRVILAGKSPENTPVSDAMTRQVVTIDLSHAFGDCLRLMHQHAIRHLPIVSNGKPVAVISIRDLLAEAVRHHETVINALERERMTVFTSTA